MAKSCHEQSEPNQLSPCLKSHPFPAPPQVVRWGGPAVAADPGQAESFQWQQLDRHIKRTRGFAPRPWRDPIRSSSSPSWCSPRCGSSLCSSGPGGPSPRPGGRELRGMFFAAARCLLFVLRCAPRPRCARPGVLSFSSADSLFVPGLWPLRGRCRVLSALRGLRCRCAPPPSPFRCAVPVSASPVVLSAGRRVFLRASPWAGWSLRGVLSRRWWRLRRAVRCPARFACWSTVRFSLSGAAPRPLHLRRSASPASDLFIASSECFSGGCAPRLSARLPLWFTMRFPGLRPGALVVPRRSCSGVVCACGGR